MAERLTSKQIKEDIIYGANLSHEDLVSVIDKLGKLEDVLEKYGIESVEDLQIRLFCTNIKNKEKIQELWEDRDTWKKACELAVGVIRWEKGYSDIVKTMELLSLTNDGFKNEKTVDYFYKKAKESNNGER